MEKTQNQNTNTNENVEKLNTLKANQENLLANAIKINFNKAIYKKAIFKTYLLSSDELKKLNDTKKAIKNINDVLVANFKYNIKNNIASKNILISNYNFDAFMKNLNKLTLSAFNDVLEFVSVDNQKQALANAILDFSPSEMTSSKTFEASIKTMQVVKQFIINIIVMFNNL